MARKGSRARKTGSGTRRSSARTRRRAPASKVRIAEAPASLQKKLASRVRRVLRELRIADSFAQIQFELEDAVEVTTAGVAFTATTTATTTPTPVPATGGCPPNTVRRIVCEFVNGSFFCEPRCVPK